MPVTVDYVPIFPWFGVVLAGIVVGRLVVAGLLDTPLARWRPTGPAGRAVVWVGRWSLAIYLIHQPILYGLLWAAGPVLPPRENVFRASFVGQCVQSCRLQDRAASICQTYCGCMFTHLQGTDLASLQSVSQMTAEQRARWNAILAECVPAMSTK